MNAPHSVSDDGVDCVYIEAGHLSVCTTVRLQNYTESGGHQTAVLCQRHVHGQEGQLEGCRTVWLADFCQKPSSRQTHQLGMSPCSTNRFLTLIRTGKIS